LHHLNLSARCQCFGDSLFRPQESFCPEGGNLSEKAVEQERRLFVHSPDFHDDHLPDQRARHLTS
jgi:hypothetical protein